MEEKSPKAGLSPDWQRGRTLNPSDTKKNDTRIVTIVGMGGGKCPRVVYKFLSKSLNLEISCSDPCGKG